jgi:hypothetical protein
MSTVAAHPRMPLIFQAQTATQNYDNCPLDTLLGVDWERAFEVGWCGSLLLLPEHDVKHLLVRDRLEHP